jgi:cytoskeletal protein RodZ
VDTQNIVIMDDNTEEHVSPHEARSVENPPSNLVSDPDALAKLLEMELILKRETWQRRRSQRGTWRALSILFFVLVIVGALAAYFFFATTYRQSGEPSPSVEAKDSSR